MTIGEQIKYFRKKKGLTQGKLAQEIGASSNKVIYHYESGFRNPSFEVLEKISIALGCDLIIELRPKSM